MKNSKILILLILLHAFSSVHITAQNKPSGLTRDEINTMNSAIKADTNLSKLLGWFGKPLKTLKVKEVK